MSKKQYQFYKRMIIFILLFVMNCYSAMISYAENSMDLSAASAILMDRESRRVLCEKDAYTKRPMASTTKIMTALLALEKGNMEDMVKTSARAAHVEGSSMWLAEGETLKLEDMLYGLMLSSGNDAAIAIAEHISGSVEKFAEEMTWKAHEIGAVNTSFKNPSGLDEEGHYTTAYDLALITCYALENEKFAEIVKTKRKTVPWQGHQWDRVLKNHNKLLSMYEGCDGVKTGFTKKTGRCLVSSATRDNWQLVAVTLKAPNDWEDHKKLLDYGFHHYKRKEIIREGEYMKTIPVKGGMIDKISLVASSSFEYPIQEGDEGKFKITYEVPDFIEAPVGYKQEIGKVHISFEDKPCGSIPLVSDDIIDKVEIKTVKNSLKKIIKNWLLMFV